jgi:SPP1 family predicted phage head-tail adaptor
MAFMGAHLLDKVGSTKRATQTLDAGRSTISTFATYLTGLPCRVQPLSGSEQMRYARENIRVTHAVFLEGGQDITEEDQFVVGGLTFDIQFVKKNNFSDDLMRLDCEETKP